VAARPLSIVHVIGWIAERYGGPPRNVRDVAAALTERGHRVTVLTTDRDGPRRLPDSERRRLNPAPHWEVVPVPTRGPALSPSFVRRAWQLVGEADVVHLHGIYSPATAIAGVAAVRRGVPFVQQLHGAATDYHWRQKRWKKGPWELVVQRPLLNRAGAAIAMTEVEARQGARVFPGALMRIVPPPVVRESGRADHPGSDGDGSTTIGFLGRISEKKGAPILLDAFARIVVDFPQARLVVAGPDDEGIGARMRTEIERLGLGERVSLPGMVIGKEKAKLVGEFDVFALPSADESFGIAVVEAMEAELPVAITEHVAIAGEVRAAGAGVVAPRTGEGFATALRQLLSSPEEARRMGIAGRRLAEERFSRAAAMAELERVYEEAID
jgi:glycosyltransferase involved in cell wall biosynthesis